MWVVEESSGFVRHGVLFASGPRAWRYYTLWRREQRNIRIRPAYPGEGGTD